MAAATTIQLNSNVKESNPFAAISGGTRAENLPTIMPLRLAIIGPSGVGKTWAAMTAPKPILHYDFDNRAASVKKYVTTTGQTDIYTKTLVDTNPLIPTVCTALENDLVMLKSMKQAGNPIPVTYVLDSALYLKKYMENSLLSQDGDMGKKFKISPTKTLRLASAMTSADVIRSHFEYFINEFSTLGHVIVIFHTKDQTDKKKSTQNNPAYTGKFTTEPQYLETVLSIINERWRLDQVFNQQTSKMDRAFYTNNDSSFKAISSMLIDDIEPANIELILAKHKARVEAKAVATK